MTTPTEPPTNVEPASTMTGKELLEMFKEKYTEALTPALESLIEELTDEAFDEGYRLGLENGHDAADGAPESPTIESAVLNLIDIVQVVEGRVTKLEEK